MLELVFIYPFIAGVIIYLAANKKLNAMLSFLYSAIMLYAAIIMVFSPKSAFLINHISKYASPYFKPDPLSILFFLVLAILYFGVSIYNMNFLLKSNLPARRHSVYTIFFIAFVFSMAGTTLSSNLALMWVFMEATTLTSAYLIYFNQTKSSLEAAWKYLFICSIGIALAFVGIIFLTIASGQFTSLFFDDLYKNASKIYPYWLKLSIVFMIFGFGTKAGLAPVHAWLPDAHSESASPVSALLSGALLNTALLAILRVHKVAKLAGAEEFSKNILLIMGFLSILVCAVFIIRSVNYKRMLAYSSIENIGIITIGSALGGIAVYGALLHLVAHSLIKSAFFLTSGNILHSFETKEIDKVSGLLKYDNLTAWLWIFCFVFLAGIPPSPVFFSEYFIAKKLILSGNIALLILFLLLLTIIIFGMGASVFRMAFGRVDSAAPRKELNIFYYITPIALLFLCLIIGIFMPSFINDLINLSINIM